VEKQIYYHDTDCGGIVYYANYLKYMEEARTEFLEEKGVSVRALQERGLSYAVRKCALSYRAPARYGETITCDAQLTKLSAAQMVFAQKVTNQSTGQVLVEGEVCLASLTKDLKPVQIPDDIKALLTS